MVANAGMLKRRFKEPLAAANAGIANAEIESVSIQDFDLHMSNRDVASLAGGYAAQRSAQGA